MKLEKIIGATFIASLLSLSPSYGQDEPIRLGRMIAKDSAGVKIGNVLSVDISGLAWLNFKSDGRKFSLRAGKDGFYGSSPLHYSLPNCEGEVYLYPSMGIFPSIGLTSGTATEIYIERENAPIENKQVLSYLSDSNVCVNKNLSHLQFIEADIIAITERYIPPFTVEE